MIIILIRHGRTEANEKRLYCGCTDLPLSENGRSELIKLRANGPICATEGLRIITSGMRRTDETLRLLFDRSPETVLAELREMNFGRFEMRSWEELKDDPDYTAWIMDQTGSVTAGGGESGNAFHERIFRSLDSLTEDCLIVTHGGVITSIMGRLFPEENKGFYDWQPPCGGGYRIDTDLQTYEPIGTSDARH